MTFNRTTIIAILIFSHLSHCAEADHNRGEDGTYHALLQLRRHQIKSGDEVHLHERFQLEAGSKLKAAIYSAEMLAFFHRAEKKHYFIDDANSRKITFGGFIDALPKAVVGTEGLVLQMQGDGTFSRGETFKAKVPGIYLISGKYRIERPDGREIEITSNASLLIVDSGVVTISERTDERWSDLERRIEVKQGTSEDGLP